MTRTLRTVCLQTTAAGLALPALGQAQPAEATDAQGAGARSAQGPGPTGQRRINVEFGGGRLREYVGVLREATRPEVVNVVAPETLLNVRIGEVSLREVTIETAVKAIEWAMETRGAVMVSAIGPNAWGLTSAKRPSPVNEPPAPAAMIHVLSLRELTEPLPNDEPEARVTVSPDVVLTAVRTALETGGGAEAAEIKFHGDSGLLIVRGTPEQVQAASSVVDRMQNDMRTRRKAVREAAVGQLNLEEVRAEAEKHAIRAELLEQNFLRAREDMQRIEAMRKDGMVSDGEVNSARASLDRAKAELEAARIDATLTQARLVSAEKAFARRGEAGDDVLGDFPPGRSTVVYTAAITGKDLEGAAAGLKVLAERLGGKNASVVVQVEGGTLTVTADRDSQLLFRRVLIDPRRPKDGLVEQKSKPRPVTEEKPRR